MIINVVRVRTQGVVGGTKPLSTSTLTMVRRTVGRLLLFSSRQEVCMMRRGQVA